MVIQETHKQSHTPSNMKGAQLLGPNHPSKMSVNLWESGRCQANSRTGLHDPMPCCSTQPAPLRCTNSEERRAWELTQTGLWPSGGKGVRGEVKRQRITLIWHTLAFNNNPEEEAPWIAQVVERTKKGNITCSYTHLLPMIDFTPHHSKFEIFHTECSSGKADTGWLFVDLFACVWVWVRVSLYPLLESRLCLLPQQGLQGPRFLPSTAATAHSWSQRRVWLKSHHN